MALRFLNSGYFAGKVGIGTDSPDAKLDIEGDFEAEYALKFTNTKGTGTVSGFRSHGVNGEDLSLYNGANRIQRWDENGNSIFDGKVGIGTSGPAYELDVNSSAYVAARIESTGAGYAPASILLQSGGSDSRGQGIYQYNSISKNSWFSGVPYSTTSDDWIIAHKLEATAFNSDVAQMSNALFCVNDNGNVGIGTTNPDAPLHVLNDSSTNVLAKIRIQGDSTSGYGDIGMQSGYIRLFSNGSMCSAWTGGVQYNYINGSTATTLNSNGLGVGTTLPDFKLDVGGTFGVSDLPFNTDSVSVLVADETIGAELITNGNFATDSDWSKGGGWAISGGTANAVSATSNPMAQTVSGFAAGNIYKVRFEVTAVTNGYIRVYAYVGASGTFTNIFSSPELTTGVYEGTFEFGGTNKILRFYGSTGSAGGFAGSIDNVSVKQVTSASNQIQKRELGTGAFGPTPVGAYLPLAGGDMTGQTTHGDGVYSYWGDSNDLQIGHDGGNSYIIDRGVGDLLLYYSDDFVVSKFGTSEISIRANQDSSVELFFDNTKKFETTSTGVTVTGDIQIDSALLSNQENTDIDSAAAEVVAQVSTTYTAAFFDFVIKKTTNVRSGTVYACHDGTNVEFTETSTNDLGDTSDVTLSVDISGTNMRLLATVTSDDWSVKSLIRAI